MKRYILLMARQPLMGQGLLVVEASRLHSRHTTLDGSPLDEGSARCRDIYLATKNTPKRQTSMPPVRFEPKIPAHDRPQTHTSDRAATGIGKEAYIKSNVPIRYTVIIMG
jgi:hypothetical protein